MVNSRLKPSGPILRMALGTTLGLVLGASALVWTRSEITRLSYRLAEVDVRRVQLDRQVEKLRIEAAALSAPEKLEARASELGLRYPTPGEVVYVDLSAAGAHP